MATVALDRDQLVRDYLPLAHAEAHAADRFNGHVTRDELDALAYEGLWQAAQRYDPARGIPFGAYARHRVRGALADGLRSMDMSRNLRQRSTAIDRARHQFAARERRFPTDAELADALGWPRQELDDTRGRLHRAIPAVPLDSPTVTGEEGGDNLTLEETLVDPTADPERNLIRRVTHGEVVAMLATLRPRERMAVSLYFFEGCSQPEIGAVLGVTGSRVSQIIGRALEKLRAVAPDDLTPRRLSGKEPPQC